MMVVKIPLVVTFWNDPKLEDTRRENLSHLISNRLHKAMFCRQITNAAFALVKPKYDYKFLGICQK